MQDAEEPFGDDFRRDAGNAPVDRRFAALVGTLCAADPRFARRVSEARRLRTGQIMMLVGLVATILLGIVPLMVGMHTQAVSLLTVGAVGMAFVPVTVPLVVGLILRRVRPAW